MNRKLIILGIVAVLSVAGNSLTGCDSTPSKTTPTPSTVVNSKASNMSFSNNTSIDSDGLNNPIPDAELGNSTGISPAEVEIGDYYPGATAQWKMLVHNGDGIRVKTLSITTEENETVADIPFSPELANNSIDDIIDIKSSLANETLNIEKYNSENKTITINGFTPSVSRIVNIRYMELSSIDVYVKYPSQTKTGFNLPSMETWKWITFDKDVLRLKPLENGFVICTLKVPAAQKIDSKNWEFWIGTSQSNVSSSGSLSTSIELVSRVFVTMK